MIKNIVFDLGNVLLKFEPFKYVQGKVIDEGKAHRILQQIFLSEEWLMLNRGVITDEEAIERISTRNGEYSELIKTCMNSWLDILTPIEGTVEILKSAKAKGYNTYILSNFYSTAYEYVVNQYDFFRYFDGGVISFRENALKPEPKIYTQLINQCNIIPNESIFIDDTQENIDGASKFGFETILFTDSVTLRQELVERRILEVTTRAYSNVV